MNSWILCLATLAVTSALPVDKMAAGLPALRHEETHDKFGQYAVRYVTPEGTVVSERARLVPNDAGTGFVLAYEGEYTYIGPDGKTYATKYSSGPGGFHVDEAHLPTVAV